MAAPTVGRCQISSAARQSFCLVALAYVDDSVSMSNYDVTADGALPDQSPDP
jgi:hypothetical protein